ncbi:hypothetical protein FQ707_00370 [Bacteroidaceae bacterium HV4-6-C5C]|nr:hypothetical protein FQ707_00370 [Bacteroidaceae bacterium HV4-6-C5C]
MKTRSLFPVLAMFSCAIYSFVDKKSDWYVYLYVASCSIFICLFLFKIIALYIKEKKLDYYGVLGIISSIVITDFSLMMR